MNGTPVVTDIPVASATYFDGYRAKPHPVQLRLTDRLELHGPDLDIAWDLFGLVADGDMPPSFTRLSPTGSPARVEFTDAAFAASLEVRCPDLHRRVASEKGGRLRIALWSLAAGISLLFLTIYGVPAIAVRLAPLIPAGLEARIGTAVDAQIVNILGDPPLCDGRDGRAALASLLAKMRQDGDPPLEAVVSVREHALANALTLPGGRVLVLSDLIDQARSPDEFAGVLAHELGHVAARDPMRNLIATSGTSFLLSLILGDLTGSTVVVAIGQAAISAGYSREAENAADAHAVRVMQRAGGDATALATMLERIDKRKDDGEAANFLRSHPFTAERAARIRALAGPDSAGRRILDDREWEALRGICSGIAVDPKSDRGVR